MKRKKVDSKIEEKIITGMITSTDFLVRVASGLDVNLFSADHFKIIAQWCMKYFNRYHKAPEQHIEHIYHSWVEKGKAKEETVDAVQNILEGLSEQYEKEKSINVDYLSDQASEHFSMRKIERLRDELDFSLLEGDIKIAEKGLQSFTTGFSEDNIGVDTFRDENAWEKTYSSIQKPLFEFGSGGTKDFFSNILSRDNLMGIEGPEKRGKTWWCIEFAIRALMCRRKVVFFEVGDLSESQLLKRIGSRLSATPIFKNQCNKRIRIPKKIIKTSDEKIKLRYDYKTFRYPANKKIVKQAIKKFTRRFGISSDYPSFMLGVYPNYSVNVYQISSLLDRWAIEKDFVPDVIIIDYPDIMSDEPNTNQYSIRDKNNIRWMSLRRLSQEKHCLVIVPTQANAESYEKETLTARNFSEDKRKLAHVTGMLGLNQTEDEKKEGVMRLNWIVLRESPFNIYRCLYVGQCLDLGRAYCCGYF